MRKKSPKEREKRKGVDCSEKKTKLETGGKSAVVGKGHDREVRVEDKAV